MRRFPSSGVRGIFRARPELGETGGFAAFPPPRDKTRPFSEHRGRSTLKFSKRRGARRTKRSNPEKARRRAFSKRGAPDNAKQAKLRLAPSMRQRQSRQRPSERKRPQVRSFRSTAKQQRGAPSPMAGARRNGFEGRQGAVAGRPKPTCQDTAKPDGTGWAKPRRAPKPNDWGGAVAVP